MSQETESVRVEWVSHYLDLYRDHPHFDTQFLDSILAILESGKELTPQQAQAAVNVMRINWQFESSWPDECYDPTHPDHAACMESVRPW